VSDARDQELASGLDRVHQRIDAACSAANRTPDEVTLVVVTKTFPAADVKRLAALGVRDIAENRHQEAQAKVRECAGLDVCWHFVGRLQSNKAAAVAGYATAVHSVDRHALVRPLSRGAHAAGRTVECLIQVSLDDSNATHRGGARPEQLSELGAAVQDADALTLRGLMAVAPQGVDPESAFARLADIAQEFRTEHPRATWLSAGMSGDLEAAVRAGATHVRVGSAVLGLRPPLR
jgi:pyridoxal phosphate enzyme (YggS family)